MKSQTGSEVISPCHRALWRWECPNAGTVQPFCLPPRATRTLPSSRGGPHSHAHQPPPQGPCRPGVPSLESRGLGSRPLRCIVVRTEVTCPHLPCFPVNVGEERAKAQAGDSSVPAQCPLHGLPAQASGHTLPSPGSRSQETSTSTHSLFSWNIMSSQG